VRKKKVSANGIDLAVKGCFEEEEKLHKEMKKIGLLRV